MSWGLEAIVEGVTVSGLSVGYPHPQTLRCESSSTIVNQLVTAVFFGNNLHPHSLAAALPHLIAIF